MTAFWPTTRCTYISSFNFFSNITEMHVLMRLWMLVFSSCPQNKVQMITHTLLCVPSSLPMPSATSYDSLFTFSHPFNQSLGRAITIHAFYGICWTILGYQALGNLAEFEN